MVHGVERNSRSCSQPKEPFPLPTLCERSHCGNRGGPRTGHDSASRGLTAPLYAQQMSRLELPARHTRCAAAALGAALAFGVSGCSQPASEVPIESPTSSSPTPDAVETPSPDPIEDITPILAGTTWAGTDSDGNTWDVDLEADGTIVFAYNDYASWPDAGGVWSTDGDVVHLGFGFDDGRIDMVGRFDGLDQPMQAEGTRPQGTFTIILTREEFRAWRDAIG